mmetsp:Transcript_24372/g.36158  ORF Transcript_24372/g.36158 Transcript_24372/m.36158 type:complete len:467 (+) Transcript_24372:123-1523(+)
MKQICHSSSWWRRNNYFLLFTLSSLLNATWFTTTTAALALSSSSSPTPKISCQTVDCAIIGGGPAGLAAAIAISQSSPQTSIAIYEQDEFQPRGASIRISKRGWEAIQQLKAPALKKKLKKTSVPIRAVETKAWYGDSATTQGFQVKEPGIVKKVVSKITKPLFSLLLRMGAGIHLWHDIRMVLKEHAVKYYPSESHNTNASFLNKNCRLTNIVALDASNENDDEQFELTFQQQNHNKNNEVQLLQVKSKYVIACDGTKSQVRAMLPNELDVLLAEEKSVWRGLAPNIDVHGKATFYRGTADENTQGRSALIFPGGRKVGASWTVISDLEDGKASSMEEAKERALRVVQTMGDENCKVMQEVISDSNFVVENKLMVRDFDKPWESSYDGLVFLGDAAHPVRPTGEGMALAFEDAAVLADLLLAHSGMSVQTLRTWEQKRYLPIKTISEEIRSGAQSYYSDKSSASR